MPSGSDIRVPPRALSVAKQGRAERPGVAGSPVGAEEVHSLPTHRALKTTDTKEPPHEVIVWGLFACAAGAAVFSGSALRVSTRTLSAAKQGEDGASG